MSGILNKGNEPFSYNGDFSQRSILIHALKYYKEHSSQDFVTRIFPNVTDDKKRRLISSFLTTSPFFEDKTTGNAIQTIVNITDKATALLLTIGEEKMVDEYLQKNNGPDKPNVLINQTFNAGRDIVKSGNVQSDLRTDFKSESTTESTININNASSQKSTWRKISEFFISNILKIIIALLVAFIIYKLGWN